MTCPRNARKIPRMFGYRGCNEGLDVSLLGLLHSLFEIPERCCSVGKSRFSSHNRVGYTFDFLQGDGITGQGEVKIKGSFFKIDNRSGSKQHIMSIGKGRDVIKGSERDFGSDSSGIPKIGITLGDPGGIGPEVTLKSLSSSSSLPDAQYILFGSQSVIDYERAALNLDLSLPHDSISLHEVEGLSDTMEKGKPTSLIESPNRSDFCELQTWRAKCDRCPTRLGHADP